MSELQGPLLWKDGAVVSTHDDYVVYGRNTSDFLSSEDPAVLVLGAFDGVHHGHRKLVEEASKDARRMPVACVALTFDPDPEVVVGSAAIGSRLLNTSDRCNGLLAAGADFVIVLSFTHELASLGPQEFVERVLCKVVCPVKVFVGENFRFGHRGLGDVQTLRDLGAKQSFEVVVQQLLCMGGSTVSASHIREHLRNGMLGEANELLGRSHFVRGRVAHGRGEGTSFGFPTANVEFSSEVCLPKDGVYACYVVWGNYAWPAAVNVGAPPSFSVTENRFLEANLVGFSGNLYGEEVLVTFEAWLRPSHRFSSIEELQGVVLKNIEWVRRHLGTSRLEVQH